MRNNISRLQNFMEQGNSYYVGKNFEKAIDFYDRVLQIDPKFTEALNNKGVAYNNLNKY